MSEPTFLSQNRFLFFVSRLLILIGMVIFFASVGGLLGIYLCKTIFGVDLFQMGEVMRLSATDSNNLNALKFFQSLAGSIAMFLVPALLFPPALGKQAVNFIRIKQPVKAWYFLVSIGMILASIPLISWLGELNQAMQFPEAYSALEQSIRAMEAQAQELTKIFIRTESVSQFFLNLLIVAILPAIAEEFFFRGVLQNLVRMCFYNAHIAIIFSAIIFSGVHGQFYGFVPRLALGIVLGYMYFFSNNIWVPVLGHFLNNALALLAAVLQVRYPELTIFSDDYHFPIWASMISLILVVASFYGLNRLQVRRLEPNE